MPSQKTAWAVAAAAVATTVASWAGGPPRAVATPPPGAFGGMGGAAGAEINDIPRIHVAAPVGPEAARAWMLLGRKVDMPFPADTPLDDVLKHIREASKEGKDDAGLSIYVDPAALQDADKSGVSPVTFDMKGVPIATALELILKQLDLAYHVRPDGIVVVGRPEDSSDPMHRILDELAAIRRDSALWRPTGGGMGGGTAGPGGGMGGGMRSQAQAPVAR